MLEGYSTKDDESNSLLIVKQISLFPPLCLLLISIFHLYLKYTCRIIIIIYIFFLYLFFNKLFV